MFEKKKILITVKTYPRPSQKMRQTVCTAGVCDDGSLIRLYPIPFRLLEEYRKYKKYQWISVDVAKNESDPRPESYKVAPSSIVLGDIIPPTDWDRRLEAVFKTERYSSMCKLNETVGTEKSLGLVKPKIVEDLIIEKDSPYWSPKEEDSLKSIWLDETTVKLEKIPWKFSYRYRCHQPRCNGHCQLIEDWEVFQLFRNMRNKYGEQEALVKVKDKYMEMASPTKNLFFYVGRHSRHKAYMIIGTAAPPIRDTQLSLF